jgi:drug/metabolite transporter (DMT)-like permease
MTAFHIFGYSVAVLLSGSVTNSAVHTFANLFFLAFSIFLIAAAFLAPRGRGELGARLKRVALFIAGLLGVVSTILRLTSK